MTTTALVLDGGSGQSLAIARRLGASGWRILAEEGSRTARSRYVTDGVRLAPTDERDRFMDAVARTTADHGVDLLVPATI